MKQLNYTQLEQAIRNMQEFRGNSCFGQWIGGVYLVTSYWTTIAKYDSTNGEVWLDSAKYSSTTTRLQNIIKRAWVLS